jgi:hypothetical protein
MLVAAAALDLTRCGLVMVAVRHTPRRPPGWSWSAWPQQR